MVDQILQRLLELQEFDRKIRELEELLITLGPQRADIKQRLVHAQAELDAKRTSLRHAESEKKQFELDIEAKRQLVQKYTLQQYQTKKNEEYRALAHEIELCNQSISQLEDQVIQLLFRIDELLKEIQEAQIKLKNTEREVQQLLAEIDRREHELKTELEQLRQKRARLASEIDQTALNHYERIAKSRDIVNVVVGIDRGVCGGCHVQLPRHYIVQCRTGKELVFCPNCTRILYYTPEMNTIRAEE